MQSTDEERAFAHENGSPTKILNNHLGLDVEEPMFEDYKFAAIHTNSVLAVREMQIVKDESHITSAEICDVLLIVTGGTLCMVHSDDGYVPSFGLA